MTQDTRKDRRVKIVSLNVRYKSATVDEFIENHAHDVSRGGIYIKTANPFPAGTLLKFEIRLASDQAVIAGVGRVVWKRDAAHGQGERPAGMGVKFIKIDPPSAAVIDKLVNTRSDAGKSFESEPEASTDAPPPVLQPAAASKAQPPPAPAGNVPLRKATMMGIGITSPLAAAPASVSPPRPTPSAPPRPTPAASPLFPKTNPEAEQPAKQEQTVMKQAAELLEEALREAGGSMEDVGTNPLFSGGVAPSPAAKAAEDPAATPAAEDEEGKARALVAGLALAPAQEKKGPSEPPPRTIRDTPVAKVSDRPKVASRPPSKPPSRPPSYVSRASDAPPAKKGSGGTVLVVVGLVAAAAAGFVYKDKIFGGAPPEQQTPATAASVPSAHPAETASAGSASASASAGPSAEAIPSASASAQSTPEASAPASASASAPSAQASAAPPPAKTAAPASAPAAAAPPKPTPAAPTTAPASPSPAAAPSTPTAAAAPAPAAPKPAAPKPKPKAAEEDNPY